MARSMAFPAERDDHWTAIAPARILELIAAADGD
jgi:hypothetical protein